MSSAAAQLHQADQQSEDSQYYRSVLHELIEMGMGLARAVHQQGTALAGDAAATPGHGAAEAFDRISRAIRRTVALARRIAEPLPARAAAGQDRAAARRRIIREVEDTIQRTYDVDAEALGAELSERLDSPDLDDEIDDRPVADIVADICRDLGLMSILGNHPWKRRTPGDIAALCARAAQFPAACVTPGHGEVGTGPPSLPPDAPAELLHLTPRYRGK